MMSTEKIYGKMFTKHRFNGGLYIYICNWYISGFCLSRFQTTYIDDGRSDSQHFENKLWFSRVISVSYIFKENILFFNVLIIRTIFRWLWKYIILTNITWLKLQWRIFQFHKLGAKLWHVLPILNNIHRHYETLYYTAAFEVPKLLML